VPLLGSEQTLKPALDGDWDDPAARTGALVQVLAALSGVEAWLDHQAAASEAAQAAVAIAQQVRDQDVEALSANVVRLRPGVAKDRRISVEDGEMRHGRKSRSWLFDGYKRHLLRDLDSGLVRAVGLTAANAPEASVTEAILADLARQDGQLSEIHLDRGYLASDLVRQRPADLAIYCKAWPVRNGDRYAKTAFVLDWDASTLRCPQGVTTPSSREQPCISPPYSARSARSGSAAPPAPPGAVCISTAMSACSRRCTSVNSRPRGERNCASGWPSSTPWRTSATGRASALAISACARTSSTCVAAPLSTICMSSHVPPCPLPSPPDYLTDVLVDLTLMYHVFSPPSSRRK
jgi:hypothetical protein